MIDRAGQSGRYRLLARSVETRSAKIGADMHSSAGNDDRAAMSAARAMGTRRFLVVRIRLRTLRHAMVTARISNGIGYDITSKCTDGNKTNQRKQPRCAKETHGTDVLTSLMASVKLEQCSSQFGFAKSQCVGYHRNRAEAHRGAGNHRTQ
jgi:hypothetical protein